MTAIPREFVDAYGQVLCPLPGCREPLHFERVMSGGVHVNVDLTLQSPAVGGYDLETWTVNCEGGHVVLLDSDEEGRPFGERPDYSDDGDDRVVDDMARLAALYGVADLAPVLHAHVEAHPEMPGRDVDAHRAHVYVVMSPEEARSVRDRLDADLVVRWHGERWVVHSWDDERSTPHDARAWLRLAPEQTTALGEPDGHHDIPIGTPVKLTPVP